MAKRVKIELLQKKPMGIEILEVLRERGKTDAEIENMTVIQVLEEYFAWEVGDPAWGRDAARIVNSLYESNMNVTSMAIFLGFDR